MKRLIPSGSHILLAATVCVALLPPPSQAQFLWAKCVASTTTWANGPVAGMSLDTNGNCYVTGQFDGANDFGGVTRTNLSVGGSDIFVAEYNSSGVLQWAQRAGGSPANLNFGRGVGVDTNGNVYVTGGVSGPADFGSFNLPASSSQVFFLAKYDNAGTVQWVQQGVGGHAVYGTELAVDGAGNSYALAFAHNGHTITFGSTNVPTPSEFGGNFDTSTILVKYDDTGAVQWASVMGGYGETLANKVAVDAAGNVYVSGYFKFNGNITIGTSNLVLSTGSSQNSFIAKFDNSGALTWVQQLEGADVNSAGVAVDQAEDVYVTGSFNTNLNCDGISPTNSGSSGAFVAKYSSSGAIQWALQAGGTNVGDYFDVAVDGQSNIYPAGSLSSDAAVAKYNPAGTLQWTYSAGGPPATPVASIVSKCAVDSAGNCFLAGWYQGTATFGTNVLQPQGVWNFFLAKVAAQTYTFGPEVQSSPPPASITYDSNTDFFQYTDTTNTESAKAYLPLSGSAAALVTTSNGWTASINASLSATWLSVSGGVLDPHTSMGLGILAVDGSNNPIHFLLSLMQMNNTAGGDTSDFPLGFYGSAVRVPGGTYLPTALGNAFAYSNNVFTGGDCAILPLAAGTNAAGSDESVGATNGILTLTYDASTTLITAYFNQEPVAEQSIAGWSQLTLVVGGGDKEVGATNGSITASNFCVSALPTGNPVIQTTDGNFGVRTNRFGFSISGASASVVIEACTNLANPVWQPVATNTLTGGTSYFSDPQWTNYPGRFYRIRSP